MAINHDMGMQAAAGAQNHVFANNTIGPDLAVHANLRLGMDNRGWMNPHFGLTFCYFIEQHAFGQTSPSINVTSASLTTSPATLQTPLALPILPRCFVSSTSMIKRSPGRTGLRHFTFSAAMKYASWRAFSARRSISNPAT